MKLLLHIVTDEKGTVRYFLRTEEGYVVANVHIEPLPAGAIAGPVDMLAFVGVIAAEDVRATILSKAIDQDRLHIDEANLLDDLDDLPNI